jgi:hypothetical protein
MVQRAGGDTRRWRRRTALPRGCGQHVDAAGVSDPEVPGVLHARAGDPPLSAVKCPARPCKHAVQNRFAVGNAKAAKTPRAGPDRVQRPAEDHLRPGSRFQQYNKIMCNSRTPYRKSHEMPMSSPNLVSPIKLRLTLASRARMRHPEEDVQFDLQGRVPGPRSHRNASAINSGSKNLIP